MRLRFQYAVIITISLLFFSACKDSDEDKATIDGGAEGFVDSGHDAEGSGRLSLENPSVQVLIEGAEISGANGMFFDGDDQLYVASVHAGKLFVIEPDTGETIKTIEEEQGVLSPDDVTIAPDGSVYFTNTINGIVGSLSPEGKPMELANLGMGVNSITLSDDGRLFVGLDFMGDGLYELDSKGETEPREVIATPGWINAMDFGPDGFLYGPIWSQATVARIDPDSGDMNTVASEFESLAAAVKFDSKGQLHVLEHLPAHVVRLDVETGERTIVATYERAGDNLAFDSNDRLFMSSCEDGSVHEVMSDGALREVKKGGLVGPTGIAVEERDGVEAVTVMATQALNTYNGATGEAIEHRSLPFEFGSFKYSGSESAIRIDGQNLLVADWGPGKGIEVWDVQGGEIKETYAAEFAVDVIRFQGNIVVSQFFTNSIVVVGPDAATPLVEGIVSPTGLAARDDDLFVASFTTGEILQVVEEGEVLDSPRVVASDITKPEGLAVWSNSYLVVVETGSGDVTAIDISSGEKTVLAESISPAFTLLAEVPFWNLNGIAVGPSGTIYVSSPSDGNLFAISFDED